MVKFKYLFKGRGNIKPIGGGIVYGNYLKSHNVNPHRGKNQPPNKETYESAIIHAQ